MEAGTLWLVHGPASILAELIPAGILAPRAVLRQPPMMVAAVEILPENLPDAWSEGTATAFAIATALSQRAGQILPWKTVKDVITASLNARFTELEGTLGDWPCDYPAAQAIKLRVATAGVRSSTGSSSRDFGSLGAPSRGLVAHAELEPSEIQDLSEIVPQLLEIKAKAQVPLKFWLQVALGDRTQTPPDEAVQEVNKLLDNLQAGFHLEG